jgi:hypothetical protein
MNERAVATILTTILCVIVAGVGGAVTLLDPDQLAFKDYAETVSTFAIGVGLLAIGRGLMGRSR